MGVSEYIRSPIFRAGGYDWCVLFYPNGYDDCFAGNASAYLTYLGETNDVSAYYTLSVQGGEGQAPVASFGPRKQVFSVGAFCTVGYPMFAERSKLKSLSRLGDGCFTIRCILTFESESPPLELPTDVTIGVGGREFRAHRSVLAARSPELHEQFFGPMVEKDMPRLEVADMEPTFFEMLLHYVYTDSLPRCEDEGGYSVGVLQDLMVVARRYKMDSLRLMCEEQLSDQINMGTVTTMHARIGKSPQL
jgi:speckle-type POZ protein